VTGVATAGCPLLAKPLQESTGKGWPALTFQPSIMRVRGPRRPYLGFSSGTRFWSVLSQPCRVRFWSQTRPQVEQRIRVCSSSSSKLEKDRSCPQSQGKVTEPTAMINSTAVNALAEGWSVAPRLCPKAVSQPRARYGNSLNRLLS
jgi:hypothetical protein